MKDRYTPPTADVFLLEGETLLADSFTGESFEDPTVYDGF